MGRTEQARREERGRHPPRMSERIKQTSYARNYFPDGTTEEVTRDGPDRANSEPFPTAAGSIVRRLKARTGARLGSLPMLGHALR